MGEAVIPRRPGSKGLTPPPFQAHTHLKKATPLPPTNTKNYLSDILKAVENTSTISSKKYSKNNLLPPPPHLKQKLNPTSVLKYGNALNAFKKQILPL